MKEETPEYGFSRISQRKANFIEMKGVLILVKVDDIYKILKSQDMKVELDDQCFCQSYVICHM